MAEINGATAVSTCRVYPPLAVLDPLVAGFEEVAAVPAGLGCVLVLLLEPQPAATSAAALRTTAGPRNLIIRSPLAISRPHHIPPCGGDPIPPGRAGRDGSAVVRPRRPARRACRPGPAPWPRA